MNPVFSNKMKSHVFPFFMGMVFLIAGCNKNVQPSHWKDWEIIINGDYADWQNRLVYFKEANLSAGFINDDENLYLCLATRNRQDAMKIMGMGLTVWLDSEGGKKKTLGIRYPVAGMGKPIPMSETRTMMEHGPDGMKQFDLAKIIDMIPSELEILDSDKKVIDRIQFTPLDHLKSCIGDINGTLVYELQIPFEKSEKFQYGIGVEKGSVVGIGFETSEIDREMMSMRMAGMRGGGMGGGGRPGGPGRPPGGPRAPENGLPEMSGPLKVWVKVQLAVESEG